MPAQSQVPLESAWLPAICRQTLGSDQHRQASRPEAVGLRGAKVWIRASTLQGSTGKLEMPFQKLEGTLAVDGMAAVEVLDLCPILKTILVI